MTKATAKLTGITAEIVHLTRTEGPFALLDGAGKVRDDAAARECRVRVRAACTAASPPTSRALLEPTGGISGVPLRGPGADLAVALTALGRVALGEAPTLYLGELSLAGEVRGVRGVLPVLRAAVAAGITRALVPLANEQELRYAPEGIEIRTVRSLAEALEGGVAVEPFPSDRSPDGPSWRDVEHHEGAVRVREAVLGGARRLLLVGVPGAGKTMLARRVTDILPPPTDAERADIATIASAAGLPTTGARPFRAPHHTASSAAIVGGGDPVRPGEVTLAHGGVLYLDEATELPAAVLDALRYALTRGRADVTRAGVTCSMPADPLVIAACNPCPCGYLGSERRECTCTPARLEQYRTRIERVREAIDAVVIEVPQVAIGAMGVRS